MPSAILFDLDDTLTDWPSALNIAISAGLESLGVAGVELAQRSLWDEIRAYTWLRRGEMVVDRAHWKLVFEPQVPWERAFPLEPRAAVKAAAQAFRAALDPRPFAETEPVLAGLAGTHVLGVLSNNPMAAHLLRGFGLGEYFKAVVSPDDPYRKPHVRAFIDACAAMGAEPRDCVYVGDSFANDAEGAHAAGLAAVWLDRFGDEYPLPAGARRVSNLMDLQPLLQLG
ncbi:MAG: HAD family hydrolase [Dehalococcoidia bacterium]